MKPKVLIIMIVLCVITVMKNYAIGFGAQANFDGKNFFSLEDTNFDSGASLLISPSDHFHIAVNWYYGDDKHNTIGLTFDGIPFTLPILRFKGGSFNFNMGVGIFTNVTFHNGNKKESPKNDSKKNNPKKEDPGFAGGVRIPVGINLLIGPRRTELELFAHVVPSFGVNFLPELGLSSAFFPVAIGARIWLR